MLPEDDAATVNWGDEWRMPTVEELQELTEECYMVWTNSYKDSEVSGVIFYKAKVTEDKGTFVCAVCEDILSSEYTSFDAHVFLPAAGDSDGSAVNSMGVYWSSSLYEKSENFARRLYFNKEKTYWVNGSRDFGFPVRAVRVQK